MKRVRPMHWSRLRGRSVSRHVGVLGASIIVAMSSIVLGTFAAGSASPESMSPEAWSPNTMATPVHYVALGDSRAAGPTRSANTDADGCDRTTNGYPNLVSATLAPASFIDVSCGGATTADVVDRDQITNPPVRRRVPVQASALQPDTTLVTLSIGGNDLRWRGLLTPCFGTAPSEDQICRSDPGLQSTIAARFATLATDLDHVLQIIRERSPLARIVVVGHGGYFGSRGCWPDAALSDGDATFVASFFTGFDNVLAGSALRNNAIYVDVASPAVGHDACAPPAQRWFTGSVFRGETPANHPTPAGSAAMAQLVLAAIGN